LTAQSTEDYLTWNLKPWLESTLADAEANAGAGSGVISAGPNIADIELRLHEDAGRTWSRRSNNFRPE
jgi:hypothetical protein